MEALFDYSHINNTSQHPNKINLISPTVVKYIYNLLRLSAYLMLERKKNNRKLFSVSSQLPRKKIIPKSSQRLHLYAKPLEPNPDSSRVTLEFKL